MKTSSADTGGTSTLIVDKLKTDTKSWDSISKPLLAQREAWLAEQARKQAEEEEKKRQAEEAAKAQPAQVAVVQQPAQAPSGDVKSVAYDMVCARWGCDQWPALDNIVTRESGWNPNALNPGSGACGLFQALPCSKMGGTDVGNQLNWGLNYIAGRYGTPNGAWAFWLVHHWY